LTPSLGVDLLRRTSRTHPLPTDRLLAGYGTLTSPPIEPICTHWGETRRGRLEKVDEAGTPLDCPPALRRGPALPLIQDGGAQHAPRPHRRAVRLRGVPAGPHEDHCSDLFLEKNANHDLKWRCKWLAMVLT